jgi:16S rRNA A1518/A1519 N6-dimethyltransferase RsmA/KsgA/DIM1 with predicted DNA glycosylase/AP lyase activity
MSNEQILKLIKDTELNLKVLKAHFTEKPKVDSKAWMLAHKKRKFEKK